MVLSSVQFGVELTEDVYKAVDTEIVDLAALPAVLTPRVAELLRREAAQTVRRPLHHLRLTVPTTTVMRAMGTANLRHTRLL